MKGKLIHWIRYEDYIIEKEEIEKQNEELKKSIEELNHMYLNDDIVSLTPEYAEAIEKVVHMAKRGEQ